MLRNFNYLRCLILFGSLHFFLFKFLLGNEIDISNTVCNLNDFKKEDEENSILEYSEFILYEDCFKESKNSSELNHKSLEYFVNKEFIEKCSGWECSGSSEEMMSIEDLHLLKKET